MLEKIIRRAPWEAAKERDQASVGGLAVRRADATIPDTLSR